MANNNPDDIYAMIFDGEPVTSELLIKPVNLITRKIQPHDSKVLLDMRFKANKEYLKEYGK